MQILISLLTSGLGIGRSFPLITGLILLSVVGMGWSYYQGGQGAKEQYKAERAEAIEKDAKENSEILKEAHKDELEHQTIITKSQATIEGQINDIKNLPANKCLDTKLSSIGLR